LIGVDASGRQASLRRAQYTYSSVTGTQAAPLPVSAFPNSYKGIQLPSDPEGWFTNLSGVELNAQCVAAFKAAENHVGVPGVLPDSAAHLLPTASTQASEVVDQLRALQPLLAAGEVACALLQQKSQTEERLMALLRLWEDGEQLTPVSMVAAVVAVLEDARDQQVPVSRSALMLGRSALPGRVDMIPRPALLALEDDEMGAGWSSGFQSRIPPGRPPSSSELVSTTSEILRAALAALVVPLHKKLVVELSTHKEKTVRGRSDGAALAVDTAGVDGGTRFSSALRASGAQFLATAQGALQQYQLSARPRGRTVPPPAGQGPSASRATRPDAGQIAPSTSQRQGETARSETRTISSKRRVERDRSTPTAHKRPRNRGGSRPPTSAPADRPNGKVSRPARRQ
jgi:hypothetical protein